MPAAVRPASRRAPEAAGSPASPGPTDAARVEATLAARVEAAEAGLRNDALGRPGALALLETALARTAEALGATAAAAFVSPGGPAGDPAGNGAPLVRCAAWPATAPPEPDDLDARLLRGSARGPHALGDLGAAWPHPLALPVGGAADGVLVVSRDVPWTDAETAAGGRLAALFSTLWAWAEAEARFQRTVADLDDCLFTVGHDAAGRRLYTFVTPQAEALTGLDPDALLAGDADWAALVHPDDRARFAGHDARLRAGEPSRVDVRLVLALPSTEGKGGETVWVSERATPGMDAAGRPTASGVLQDVTVQKEAEATLDRARRVAERAAATRMAFLRLMSHELRTPLGAIRGFAELLADEVAALPGAPPEAMEFAGTIREAADRALHLVASLLDLSRLETGALDLAAVPVDLATVTKAVAARYAGRVPPGVALAVHAPAEAVAVGDPVRVESVVDALVANAVAFTPAGEIVVAAGVDGEHVWATVRDTGVGMAADFAERLFEPFAQEDTRLARGHEGAGLSLAIAHRLVTQMGGRLAVETSPGVGATFTVTLPAA